MAPSKKGQATQAEVALLQSLKNCLVNLPTSLVSLLDNANTVAQDVIVEISFRQSSPAKEKPVERSVFFGWTGMASKRKPTGVVGREGLNAKTRDQETIEIDATFGRLVGILDGQKVGVHLHLDPPQAHTIAIEPLTPVDWEIIELHAQFLELNFLSQIRALPNPAYNPPEGQRQPTHPLTLHLSPTSTANVIVTSLTPPPATSSAFAKISPDAEVHVAPKTREQSERASESRSVASAGRRSAGGRSGTSTVRRRSGRRDGTDAEPVFLRGVDMSLGGEWFEDDETMEDFGLKIWVDRDLLLTKPLRGVTWASVSIVKPAGLMEPVDPQKEAAETKYAPRVVARLGAWEDAPDSHHAALSSMLAASLTSTGMVGGLVRVEAAPSQISKYQSSDKEKGAAVKALQIEPFVSGDASTKGGLHFGGDSKQEKEEAVQAIKNMYGKGAGGKFLEGPLTDGMILPPPKDAMIGWQGALIKFDPQPAQSQDGPKSSPTWFVGSERNFNITMREETTKPSAMRKGWSPAEPLPPAIPSMVGIDPLITDMMRHLSYQSSVLLTGGLGAGKTSLAFLLAHRLRKESLFHTAYFSCRHLVGDETRISTIRETLNRLFGSAAWGARSGGRSVVILDDLDQLCPAESELQVGGENGRSRQISEIVCSLARQYCAMGSGVALLATSQAKETVNNVVIGGHVVREIVSLKAPNKEGRRRVLEALVYDDARSKSTSTQNQTAEKSINGSKVAGTWHDHSSSESRPSTSSSHGIPSLGDAQEEEGFIVDKSIDFLDLAGQTDGYMPGDLVLLVSRARSEALMRVVAENAVGAIVLGRGDFVAALKGFIPASLRNVTLQSSTTKWSSIGGLHSTRQTLLETLQYPTTYAPIFAQCPLRLRSGLLLYGYPGCGKTLLASAVAGECGLNFISVKGPEILNKYIGASEKSVRDLFDRAEAARPCVLFFDEFDSIAPKRGHDSTGVTDRVVNQLLTQMDGAEGLSGVYVLAATSRPDLIDPALLRPGRLDKSLMCNMPDMSERIDILRAVSSHLRFEPSMLTTHEESGTNLVEIARRTEGYSGADLQAVVYNAQLEAIHDALGDADPSLAATTNSVNGSGAKAYPVKTPDFMHFRYGDALEPGSSSNENTPAAMSERASIAAKIAQLQATRRKEREARHASYGVSKAAQGNDVHRTDDKQTSEPVIAWKHVTTSLSSTRASISPHERRRLEGIYREFVSGRNGELPNGQGSTEIGGRTSLM